MFGVCKATHFIIRMLEITLQMNARTLKCQEQSDLLAALHFVFKK